MQNINKILKKYYLQIAAIVSLTINLFELLGNLVADADGFHSATESSAIKISFRVSKAMHQSTHFRLFMTTTNH